MKDKQTIKKRILKAIEQGGTQTQILKRFNWYDFKYVTPTIDKKESRKFHNKLIDDILLGKVEVIIKSIDKVFLDK